MSESSGPQSDTPSSKSRLKDLAIHLGALQREAKKLGIPALVVIEGLDASEKGRLLNQVLLEIDTRSYNVYSTHASHQEPRDYPLLWRFWNNTPAQGQIQFYDRGPCYLALDAWAEGQIKADILEEYWQHIRNFEKQLNDNGVEIIKIFLTVPKKEQARRLEVLEQNPKTAWRVTAKDWQRHKQYKSYMKQVKAMIEATNASFAEWTCIDTGDLKEATTKLYQLLIHRLQAAIDRKKATIEAPEPPRVWIPYKGKDFLSDLKFKRFEDRAAYKQALGERQERIHELVHQVYSSGIPVVMVYCGWDAAGKGGCIKRLVQGIDPRGYHVTPVGAPTHEELHHHYLWRFWKQMPKRGSIEIFDRSWYGRVLVERVEGLCSNEEWQRAYQEINEMEGHLADFGTLILKFWLHIDEDTQLERFKARQKNPFKQWKITEEDWRNRDRWDHYKEAVNEMIKKTDKPHAPWFIVPSVCKQYARIQTLDITIKQMEKMLKRYIKPAL